MPVKLKVYEDPDQPTEVSKIEFNIPGKITRKEICEARLDKKNYDLDSSTRLACAIASFP